MRLLIVASALLLIPALVSAHHGQAAYNTKESVTVNGTVTAFEFVNPHVIVNFDVKGAKGDVQKWQGELTSPNHLARVGWNRSSLKNGDRITVTGWRAVNGATSLWLTKLVLSDGQELKLVLGN